MNPSNKRLTLYLVITLITTFLGDKWVEALMNEPNLVSSTHWFSWLTIVLNSVLQMLIVWRAFIDESSTKYRDTKNG